MLARPRTILSALSLSCAALVAACSSGGAKSADDAPSTSASTDASGGASSDGSPASIADAAAGSATGASGSKADAPSPDAASTKASVPDGALGGELSQADIQKLVEQNVKLFDPCYSIASGGKKTFAATVELKATIGPAGTVNAIEATKSSDKSKKLDECVMGAFKQIKFPKPHNGATSVIKYPMKLEGSVQ